MNLPAFGRALAEIHDLRTLHDSTLYAYSQTEEVLRYRLLRRSDRGDRPADRDLKIVSPIRFQLKASKNSRMRNSFRELLFVRLVSVLEAYLVDTVRDIFVKTKKPFLNPPVQAGFTQAELLSAESMSHIYSRIINRECRRLTSGGYEEIAKYYANRLEIFLDSLPPGKHTMVEYHDRRHLLIHRLGKPDEKYLRDHKFSGKRLSVDEDYLSGAFADFKAFIRSVDNAVVERIQGILNEPGSSSSRPMITYQISLFAEVEPAIFHDAFQFWVGDSLMMFRDIAQAKVPTGERKWDLVLSGNQDVLKAFQRHIRRAERQGHIGAREIRRSGFSGTRQSALDPELIARVAEALPQQPWPTGTHRVIAASLGLSNGTVSDVIQTLIQRGDFKQQIDGKVVD